MQVRELDATCYMCDCKSTSNEHAPPKSFFPKGMRRNLITVPSCDKHNAEKSKDDDYIRIILSNASRSMDGNPDFIDLREKSGRALERSPLLAATIFKDVERIYISDLNCGIAATYSSSIDLDRFLRFFGQLSRAIFFNHKKAKWLRRIYLYPHFLLGTSASDRERQADEELLRLYDGGARYGDNPDVFFYKFSYLLDSEGYFLSMCFYNDFKITSVFLP